MTLSPDIERLLRGLARAIEPEILEYRSDVIAGTKYVFSRK
jgi:hypothetical protein